MMRRLFLLCCLLASATGAIAQSATTLTQILAMRAECKLQMTLGTCAPYEDNRPPRPAGSRVWVSGKGGSGWHSAETYDFLRSHKEGMCNAAARACIADSSGRVCALSSMLWGAK